VLALHVAPGVCVMPAACACDMSGYEKMPLLMTYAGVPYMMRALFMMRMPARYERSKDIRMR